MLLAFSCEEEELKSQKQQFGALTVEDVTLGSFQFKKISGSVDQDFTLTSDIDWLIDGGVSVESGAQLNIEAGTSIYAAFNERTSLLTVQRGGKINATGTEENPIYFTSIRKLTSVPSPGDWGGIIINGNAPINLAGGEGEGEGGTGTYGGNNPSDDSGVLRYVIIEYGGKNLGVDNELNGLSLNGVGNGTTIEYVETLYGLDDGIEIFGGTVNLRYMVSLGNGDDSFDWTYGWTGYGQFWVAQQDPFDGDRGIEGDNNEDDFDAVPFSNPTIANVTLIGANDGDPDNDGIVLRNGTKAFISNAMVVNFSQFGLQVDESSAPFMTSSELQLTHSRIFNNGVVDKEADNYKNADLFRNDPTNQLTRTPDLNGFVGTESTSFDPATLDDWFVSAPYIGAVPENNNWLQNWIDFLR